jgi:hypothetical protein
MKTPEVGVVADIHDHVDFFFWNDLNQAAKKFCGAGASGENRVVGRNHRNILRGTQGGRPEVKNRSWHEMLDGFNLSLGDFAVKKTKHGARDALGSVALETGMGESL